MKKRIGGLLTIIGCLLLSVPQLLIADSLKGGYPACVTEDLYRQIKKASVSKNEREWQYLLKNGCFALPGGMEITVLDRNLDGIAKVRVFAGGEAFILWTSSKNVSRSK